ncbi:MAG: MbnP family protein [Nevskiales bacterium]
MKNRMNLAARHLAAAGLLLLAGCGHGAAQGGLHLRIEISHVVGEAPLRLGDSYKTGAGDSWSAERLRYYLSNFRLRRADSTWFVNPQSADSSRGYFLVDEADAASKQFQIGPIPEGTYSGIEFLVGVDAARNGAGAQTGTLDPARGMFWTWNTGYIFFQFEGHSPQSSDAEHALTYHTGGGADSPARSVFLQFQTPVQITAENSAELHLYADLSRLFDGAHALRPATLPTAMDPKAAAEVADNSAGLFRIDHIHKLPKAGLAQGQ